MGKLEGSKNSTLEADLSSVFAAHGYEKGVAAKLASDSVKLTEGAQLAFMVPVYSGKDIPSIIKEI